MADLRVAPRKLAQEDMFWDFVPENVIGTLAELNSADFVREWRGKKDNMERATGGPWTEFECSPRTLQSREYALRGFWAIFVDERPFCRDASSKNVQKKKEAVFSCAMMVMDKICDERMKKSGWVRNSRHAC